jgi:hypothetical protein
LHGPLWLRGLRVLCDMGIVWCAQEWQSCSHSAARALSTVKGCLVISRRKAEPIDCALLKRAVTTCGTARSVGYLAGQPVARPSLASDLSTAILQFHYNVKQSCALCESARSALQQALLVFWKARDAGGNVGPSQGAGDDAGSDTAGTISQRSGEGHVPVAPGLVPLAELLLLAQALVSGVQQHTDLLQSLVGRVDLQTADDELATYEELLSIEPYLEDPALQAFVAAFLP